MGLVIALIVVIVCVCLLYSMAKKEPPSNSGGPENIEEKEDEKRDEDKNSYNIQRIADDVHFIKTVVLIYVALSLVGILVVVAYISH